MFGLKDGNANTPILFIGTRFLEGEGPRVIKSFTESHKLYVFG